MACFHCGPLDGKGETTHGLNHGGQTHSTGSTTLRRDPAWFQRVEVFSELTPG